MPNRRSEAFVLFLLVCGLRQSAQAAPKDSLLRDVIQFSDKQVMEAIRRAGFEISGVHGLQSDRTKTKLLVTPILSSRSNWIAFAITTNGVTRQTAPPASKVFFDEGGKVVAWFTNMQEGVYFASGAFLHLASNDVVEVSSPPNVGATSAKERGVWRVARFEVDASGSRFGLASRNDRAYLGDIAHPSAVRCVATNFALNKIFLPTFLSP